MAETPLQAAERHVAMSADHIARMRAVIAERRSLELGTEAEEGVLRQMLADRVTMVRHRDELRAQRNSN